MKSVFTAALLSAASVCWADPGDGHLEGAQWTVVYNTQFGGLDVNGFAGETALSLQGDSLFWASNAFTMSHAFGTLPPVRPRGIFAFSPAEGFAISGFEVSYDLTFATSPHVADGSEYALNGVHLSPGTVITGTGSFEASTGAAAAFDYVHTNAVLTDHLSSGAPFQFQATVQASSGEYCLTPLLTCGFVGLEEVRGFLTLNSITITPTVVAVPEPEIYALMLVGLTLLVGRRARPAIADRRG